MPDFKLGDHVFVHTSVSNAPSDPTSPLGYRVIITRDKSWAAGHIVAVAEDGWYKVHRPWHPRGVWVRGSRLLTDHGGMMSVFDEIADTAARDFDRGMEQVRRAMENRRTMDWYYYLASAPQRNRPDHIEGRLALMGDHLYVTSKDNHGAHVQIVGWNMEGDPICQRIDGEPFTWRGVRRHVLDMPADCLSYKKPARTTAEIAADIEAAYKSAGLYELYHELQEADNREQA
jgi:hypothetical protein